MMRFYVMVAVATIGMAYIGCWPAVTALVPMGVWAAFTTEARALAEKTKTRAKKPAATPA